MIPRLETEYTHRIKRANSTDRPSGNWTWCTLKKDKELRVLRMEIVDKVKDFLKIMDQATSGSGTSGLGVEMSYGTEKLKGLQRCILSSRCNYVRLRK